MSTTQSTITSRPIEMASLHPRFLQCKILRTVTIEQLQALGTAEFLTATPGTLQMSEEWLQRSYWLLLKGEIEIKRIEKDGTSSLLLKLLPGEGMGEVPLLSSRIAQVSLRVVADIEIVRIHEQMFWQMMATIPETRKVILHDMGERLNASLSDTLQHEKLISLGTLAAGLMHELNNPGAAAKRAASQLRHNLTSLQKMSLEFCDTELSDDQMDCMRQLQLQALQSRDVPVMSTLCQADAEEAMEHWLDKAGIANAANMAPTLVAIGLKPRELECAATAFRNQPASANGSLSDALTWLDALVSSVKQVGIVEESVTRMTDLVMAVKKYAYERKNALQKVDVNDSLRTAILILSHKLRTKNLRFVKSFEATQFIINSYSSSLSQVWTNLIDNAIDVSPFEGVIAIRTWNEPDRVCVSVTDQGTGILKEHQEHIFEPFFTTKGVGEGTGLGLDIVRRVVVDNFQGRVSFTTKPGETQFVVRLPLEG